MRPLVDCRLYAIVDLGYVDPAGVAEMTRALVEGGADLVQLRAKKSPPAEVEALARLMHPITRAAEVPLVVNDFPRVAAAVGSEGVHVGQDDQGVEETRALVGPRCFVGKSTHSLKQARAAMGEGADYIGFGPLYATGTKPSYVPIGLRDIGQVESFATCPVFCIGGVNPSRLNEILGAGAKRVVVVSAFLQAANVREIVREVRRRVIEGG